MEYRENEISHKSSQDPRLCDNYKGLSDAHNLPVASQSYDSRESEAFYGPTAANIFGYHWRYTFVVCAFLVVVPYLPSFVFEFGVHNDYMIWSYDNRKCCLGFPESTHLLVVGRPLGAILLNLHFAAFTGIKSLAIGRGVSLLVILWAYYLFCVVLIKNYKFAPPFSLTTGLLIFSLPPVALYVVWLTNFVPGSLTVFMSVLGYFLISLPLKDSETTSKNHTVISRRHLGYAVVFLSFFIYPPVGIFCLVFPLICALFMGRDQWARERGRIWAQIGTIVSLLVLYFFVTKFVLMPILWQMSQAVREYVLPTENYQFSLSIDIWKRLFLVNEFAAITFNLWTSNYIPGFHFAVLVFIAGMILWKIVRRAGHEGGSQWIDVASRWRAATVVVLLATSAAPVFLPRGGFVAYRIVFTAASMAVVLFLWAVYEVCSWWDSRRTLPAAVAVVVGIAIVFSSLRIHLFVANVNREYEFVRSSIRWLELDKLTKVVVVSPKWGAQIVRGSLFYDFRYMGTNFARMDGIVRVALRESGMSRRRARKINVSFVPDTVGRSAELRKYFCPCVDMSWAGFQTRIPPFSLAMGPMIPALSDSPVSVSTSASVEASSASLEAVGRVRRVSGPQMIIEGYAGYNIVLYRSRIYGFPQGFKPDYTDPNLSRRKGVLTGRSVKEVMNAVDRIPKNENIGLRAPRLIAENYKGYNIVSFDGSIYGFPQGMSPDYGDPDLARKPGVVVATSEDAVRALIDDKRVSK